MSSTRGRWFGFILYPDNADQMKLHEYLVASGYSLIWIQHSGKEAVKALPVYGLGGDLTDIADPIKPHIHCMIHYPNARTASGVCKSFFGVVKHVELISDPVEMARYFLHIDFKSYMQGKETYQVSDVLYSDKSLFCSLYGMGSPELTEDYPRIIAEIGSRCSCFPELIKELYNAGRGDVVLYAMNHSGAMKMLFPHFPSSITDLKLLQSEV